MPPLLHRLAVLFILTATLGAGGAPVHARWQQAPSSRIALDLPDGYSPSAFFSGFVNDLLGVSFIAVEMPGKAYEELATGMTPEALAAKGVLKARAGTLNRPAPYIFMRAEQTSQAGLFAKFFVVFRENDVTALVTANVQKASLDKGELKAEDIERILAGARIAPTPAPAKDLFALSYLGDFKPAGSFLGTARSYTLDGRLEPTEKNPDTPMLIIAPSLDRRPVQQAEHYAETLLLGLDGVKDVKISNRRNVDVSGMSGIELTASARDAGTGHKLILYQTLLLPPGGGYFRVMGQAPLKSADTMVPEFRRIMEGLRPLP
jgi:hypothetical protein